MRGILGFEKLSVSCIIGVFPEERVQEQEIFIDMRARVKISSAAQKDRLEEGVSYVDLATLCKETAVEGKFQLLEALAFSILERTAKTYAIEWGWVRVQKPEALSQAKGAFVELEWPWDGL